MINKIRLKNLLRYLIDIYSPSGKEEDIIEFLKDYLKLHNLRVITQAVDEDRENIIVIPEGLPVEMAFIGHIDTVSAYDLEDYEFKEDGDLITGLGAADMKGNCAAMIEAFVAFQETYNSQPPVALALVVGEEEYGDGAKKLLEDFSFPSVIIGEPTDLRPCFKHYGYLEVKIETKGEQKHASLSKPGHNAIEDMLHILLEVTHYLQDRSFHSNYNIREVSSSRAGFFVPEKCEAWLDLHLPPEENAEIIIKDLKKIFNRKNKENSNLDSFISFVTVHDSYELPLKGPLFEALRNIYIEKNLELKTWAFQSHSDANIFRAAGISPVILGAGQLEQAHTSHESVSFKDIFTVSSIYLSLLRSYPVTLI